jgi:hypothetical protein
MGFALAGTRVIIEPLRDGRLLRIHRDGGQGMAGSTVPLSIRNTVERAVDQPLQGVKPLVWPNLSNPRAEALVLVSDACAQRITLLNPGSPIDCLLDSSSGLCRST